MLTWPYSRLTGEVDTAASEDGEHCHNLSRDSVDGQFLKLVPTGWLSVTCCKHWSLRPFLSSFSPCRAKPALGYVVPLLATHSESEERLDHVVARAYSPQFL